MALKVFCLVLNYRHFLDTGKCIKRLLAADCPTGTKFLVIDNSPNQTPVGYFEKEIPTAQVLKNQENFGFAKGNNVGIRYALRHGASHVLIINPDVAVGKKFFLPLLAGLAKSPQAGIIAPAIRHQQDGLTFYGLEGRVDWHTGKASHVNRRRLTKGGKTITAQFVTFACVLLRVEVFERVGLLDERYFMYLEDVDYCLRVTKMGFVVLLDQNVVVNHQTSSSFKRPTDKLLISFRSHLIFINKWLQFPKNIVPIIYTLLFYPYLYSLWTYHHYKKSLRT